MTYNKGKPDYGGYDENSYEKTTYNVDPNSIMDTEIKINPSFYIHMNLLRAQDSLVKEDMKSGLLQYRICSEHCETLCVSANLIPDEYDQNIKEFIKKEKIDDKSLTDGVKLANFKYKLLLGEVFGTRSLIGGLKIDPKKIDSDKQDTIRRI